MKYVSTTLATNFTNEKMNNWKFRLIKILLFFIPKANPDNEPLYPKVEMWLLEINDSNEAEREIALDIENKPLFCAPNNRNYGFWTDSSGPLDVESMIEISKEYFEEVWAFLDKSS